MAAAIPTTTAFEEGRGVLVVGRLVLPSSRPNDPMFALLLRPRPSEHRRSRSTAFAGELALPAVPATSSSSSSEWNARSFFQEEELPFSLAKMLKANSSYPQAQAPSSYSFFKKAMLQQQPNTNTNSTNLVCNSH